MIRDLKNSSFFRGILTDRFYRSVGVPRLVVRAFPPQTALTLFACLGLLRVHFSEMRDECVAVLVNNLFYIPQNIFVIAPSGYSLTTFRAAITFPLFTHWMR